MKIIMLIWTVVLVVLQMCLLFRWLGWENFAINFVLGLAITTCGEIAKRCSS